MLHRINNKVIWNRGIDMKRIFGKLITLLMATAVSAIIVILRI